MDHIELVEIPEGHCGYCKRNTPDCPNSEQPTCDVCGLMRATTRTENPSKPCIEKAENELKTAEQWTDWACEQYKGSCYGPDYDDVVQAITLAMNQARKEAIKDIFKEIKQLLEKKCTLEERSH